MDKSNIRKKGKIGIFAVAHATYWAQFEGLEETMMGYHRELIAKIEAMGAEVVDFGMIDSNTKAFDAVPKIQAAGVDILFCNMITYATSSVFAPILQNAYKPMILVALQPLPALDYTKANTRMQLENDNICSVPEFMGVANRLNRKIYDVVIGTLHDDAQADKELQNWVNIAAVMHALYGARMGLMGHVLESMYDMHADPTAISATFKVHVPLLEIDTLHELQQTVGEEEIAEKAKEILEKFDTPEPKSDAVTRKLTDADLHEAAKSAIALEKFIDKYNLTGLAYYYEGLKGSDIQRVASSLIVGNSMLIADGFPMCGEFDIKTCIAMLIMDRLGIGGSFAELHPFDFASNCILIGHDGPHHIQIAQGKPSLRSLIKYHGKPGSGASVEFKLKEGPITMLGITQDGNGHFRFIIGEGESQEGPIPPTGNTNTRAVFQPNTKDFVKRWVMAGPTHHYALGIGHHADELAKIAEILGVDYTIIR